VDAASELYGFWTISTPSFSPGTFFSFSRFHLLTRSLQIHSNCYYFLCIRRFPVVEKRWRSACNAHN